MKMLLPCVLASAFLSGCVATLPEGTPIAGEPDFPTGSNITRRTKAAGPKVDHMTREEFERIRMEVKEQVPKERP